MIRKLISLSLLLMTSIGSMKIHTNKLNEHINQLKALSYSSEDPKVIVDKIQILCIQMSLEVEKLQNAIND